MIKVRNLKREEIGIDQREVYRYLGYKEQKIDEECMAIISKCTIEIEKNLSCKACYDYFPIKESDGYIDLDFCKIRSKDLSKNLMGCNEIILFTATVGAAVDRIINKYCMTSPLHAVVAQAAGTAAIEKWCDILCSDFAKTEAEKKRYLRPRFSPGYGDLDLSMQKTIFSVLDCNRKIGATLTESSLMVPTKTVSAIVGIGDDYTKCYSKGCSACDKKDCIARQED